MKITPYNQHVRLLSSEAWSSCNYQVYSVERSRRRYSIILDSKTLHCTSLLPVADIGKRFLIAVLPAVWRFAPSRSESLPLGPCFCNTPDSNLDELPRLCGETLALIVESTPQ